MIGVPAKDEVYRRFSAPSAAEESAMVRLGHLNKLGEAPSMSQLV